MNTANITTIESLETLKHNIAGTLASLYIGYLCRMAGGVPSNDYCRKNWIAEYNSRIKILNGNAEMVQALNGYNDFYKCEIAQKSEVRVRFGYQPK